MNLNKKVTQEQMKDYESTLTKEQGEAQLREDARASFVKTVLEGQAKQKTRNRLREIAEVVMAVSYIIFAIHYVTK